LLKEKIKELISDQFGKEKTPDNPVEPISKQTTSSKRVKLKRMQLKGEAFINPIILKF